MIQRAVSPGIVVTIGEQTRLYHAFITSAPGQFDAPSTVTVYAAHLADVAVFAANEIVVAPSSAQTSARLVLVDAFELTWQRARCREEQHLLAPADPGLVGLPALQHRLWRRLRTPGPSELNR